MSAAEYRIGDVVDIHNCKYEVTESYLSAKGNGSYPKVLAKILGIPDMNDFVYDVLGYNLFEGKIFGYESLEDANTLIDALKNYRGVSATKSNVLENAEIKKFFDKGENLERLSALTNSIEEVLNNFNTIKNIANNIVRKISSKNNELTRAIDNRSLKQIASVEGQFTNILEYITTTEEVLAALNEIGKANGVTEEAFDAEEFINS